MRLYPATCPTCKAAHRVERDEIGAAPDTTRCADDSCLKRLCSKCDQVECSGCGLTVCLEHAVAVCGELLCFVCCRGMESEGGAIAEMEEPELLEVML